MRLNIPMLKRLALRLADRKFVDIHSLAARVLVLHPEETVSLPPAIHPEGSLERITGLSPWRNLSQENRQIFGGEVVLPPSLAYFVESVDIVGSIIYRGPAKYHPGYEPEQFILGELGSHKRIANANLVTTVGGSHFFGAMLLDDFVLELNADDPGNNIRLASKRYEHEPGYRELLGLNSSPLTRNASVGCLKLYTEPSNNSFKAARYHTLRERIRKNFKEATTSPRGVYLKRGSLGEPRLLVNEREIEQFCLGLGFVTVEPTKLSVEDIVRLTMDAPIVVSVEGSHMSHTLFTMANHASFVVLQPPDRFSTVYKEFTDCMGMRFAFAVGLPTSGGFTVPLDDMQRVLQLIV